MWLISIVKQNNDNNSKVHKVIAFSTLQPAEIKQRFVRFTAWLQGSKNSFTGYNPTAIILLQIHHVKFTRGLEDASWLVLKLALKALQVCNGPTSKSIKYFVERVAAFIFLYTKMRKVTQDTSH